MDLGSLILLLALAVIVAGFVLRPLQERKLGVVSQEEHDFAALLAERDRLLEALAELDFDKELGKIPDDLYPVQRENLLKRGAEVLRKLDGLKAIFPAADDPVEAIIASRKGSHLAKGGSRYCPNCGGRTVPGDKFCVTCGQRIS